jgi:fructuronate reductase
MTSSKPRLSNKSLAGLSSQVVRPTYDRANIQTGLVHLGLGAFHRAHQAAYTEQALNAGDHRWGIAGASLRAADTRDALAPQDGLYTVAVRDTDHTDYQVVGALKSLHVAPEDPAALIKTMAQDSVKIVSLTVTEKGYCHDPATGDLNVAHPDIQHDLAHPDQPRSVVGFLLAALAERQRQGLAPFTIMTCDNLPANGHTLQGVMTQFTQLARKDLLSLVSQDVAFPSTMVDRIVPATTDADRDLVAQALGVTDAWPIMTEPFTQWVIEDHFPQGRPDWGAFGAELVKDVLPYETMKLRLLNGSHSTLAYLGYLSGYETVAEAMADTALAGLIEDLMVKEITPVLTLPQGADVGAYRRSLLTRFHNTALRHRTWQIAMDGSQKLPQRLLSTIRERLAAHAPIDRLALGVAAWMRYVTGVDEKGQPIDVRDPMAAELRRRADQAGLNAQQLVPALLRVEAIFGKDLPAHPAFVAAVTHALDGLISKGARASVAAMPRG